MASWLPVVHRDFGTSRDGQLERDLRRGVDEVARTRSSRAAEIFSLAIGINETRRTSFLFCIRTLFNRGHRNRTCAADLVARQLKRPARADFPDGTLPLRQTLAVDNHTAPARRMERFARGKPSAGANRGLRAVDDRIVGRSLPMDGTIDDRIVTRSLPVHGPIDGRPINSCPSEHWPYRH